MKLEYFILLGICFLGPIFLSFSKKINFYKDIKRLIWAIGVPFVIFIIWDIAAVSRGHWGFNKNYITGLYLFNIPVEEVLFFIVIPFCALFTWETVKYFTRKS